MFTIDVHRDVTQCRRLNRSGGAVGGCLGADIFKVGFFDLVSEVVVNSGRLKKILGSSQGVGRCHISGMALSELGHLNLLTQVVAVVASQPLLPLHRAKRRARTFKGDLRLLAVAGGRRKSRCRLLGLGFELSQSLTPAVERVYQLPAAVLLASSVLTLCPCGGADSGQALHLAT